jgi:Helix-turn-helix domain
MASTNAEKGLDLESRLERIERLLADLVSVRQIKDYYGTDEFAQIVGKAEFTCREWCRHGRIKAVKRACGHGRSKEWAIPHDELLRYQNHGLLPFRVQDVA